MIIKQILAGLLFLFVLSSVSVAQPAKGDIAPEIVLKDANGAEQKLSDHKGKIVLIDFWASWCAPCRASNKKLAPLYSKYKAKGFEIFGISLDKERNAWLNAVKQDKIEWIQTNDTNGWEAQVALSWGIEALPTSILLDKDGKIIAINPTDAQIEAQLKKLKS